jgi:tripartite-type tricarboxylate transporter receptor subunit TctC
MTARSARARLAVASAAFLAAAALLPSGEARAQGWPSRTVKLVVPLGPGSGADIGARMIADFVSKRWGQPVVVENRPGGDSIVAITAVINANDDHTLLWGPSAAFTAHPYSHAKVPYDIKDIFPIVRVSNTLVTVSVPAAMPVKSVADLVKLAREQPGKLNWASVTGLNDFLFQAFVKDARINMVRVPYRDAVQAATDLGENRIQAYSSAYAIARPQIQAGKIRPIAFTNTRRAAILPDIPTVREAGHPALEFDGMVGAYGTKVVSEAARRRISADVRASLTDKVIHDRLTITGQVVNPGDTAEFIAAIAEQSKVAAGAAKILGVKVAQ